MLSTLYTPHAISEKMSNCTNPFVNATASGFMVGRSNKYSAPKGKIRSNSAKKVCSINVVVIFETGLNQLHDGRML